MTFLVLTRRVGIRTRIRQNISEENALAGNILVRSNKFKAESRSYE